MNCPICHLVYNKSRKPLVLTCGHTFCSDCVQLNELTQCRECRQKSSPVVNFAIYQEITKHNLTNIDKYIKVCLFGNMNVGKSSIIRRLVDDEFQLNTNPTIGIDFKFIDKVVDGLLIRFQIWDSAGQERYRSMSSHHLKGSDIILLIYDVCMKPQDNGIGYWLGEIDNYAKHNNIIVIGNKLDLMKKNNEPLLEAEQKEIEEAKWTHLQASCLSNENMDMVWQSMIEKARHSKGISAVQKNKSVILSQMEANTKSSNLSNMKKPQQQNHQRKCCD